MEKTGLKMRTVGSGDAERMTTATHVPVKHFVPAANHTNQVSTVAGDPAVDAEEILSINRKLSCSHNETPGEHQICCSL